MDDIEAFYAVASFVLGMDARECEFEDLIRIASERGVKPHELVEEIERTMHTAQSMVIK